MKATTFPSPAPTNSPIPDLMGRTGQVNINPNNQNQIRPSISIRGSQEQFPSSSSLVAGSGQMFQDRFFGPNINLPQEISANIVSNNSCNVGVSPHESTTGTRLNIAPLSDSFTRSLQGIPNSFYGSVLHYQGTTSRGHGEMSPDINHEVLPLSLSPYPDESSENQYGTNSAIVNVDNNNGYVVEEQGDNGSTSANTMCLPFKRSSSDFGGEFQEGESSSMDAQVEIAEQHVVTSHVDANANSNANENMNPSPLNIDSAQLITFHMESTQGQPTLVPFGSLVEIIHPPIVTSNSTIEIRQSSMVRINEIQDGGDVEQPLLVDDNDDMRDIMEAQDVMAFDYSNAVRMIEAATTVEELDEVVGTLLGQPEETILKYIKLENLVLEDKETQEVCCICQEEYVNGDEVGRLDCEHKFHIECIKQWLKQKNECPICRQMVLLSNDEGEENDDEEQIPIMDIFYI